MQINICKHKKYVMFTMWSSKTLISLWIAEKSISIDGSIIIGVPHYYWDNF